MNLKDKMKSASPEQKQSETNNEQNSSINITQKSNQPSREMELLEKQSEALKKVMEERDLLLKKGRLQDQEQIQTLLSEKSKLTSVITELRTELSQTQKINQSLTQNNDALRKNNGLLLRKEQEKLTAEVITTRDQNAKLMDMVDKSSVEAVDRARAERDQAIRDKEKGIKAAQSQATHETYEAYQKQKDAERKAKKAIDTLKERSFLYMGLLAFTLFCVGVMNSQVVSDFLNFFKVPAIGIYNMASDYTDWLISLSDKLEIGWAWVARILLTLLIIGACFGVIVCIGSLWKWYKSRWCTLSLKVMVVTLAIITVFGEPIRSIISINLILLFFLVQIANLFVLWYFDGYFEKRYRTDEWKAIQNR